MIEGEERDFRCHIYNMLSTWPFCKEHSTLVTPHLAISLTPLHACSSAGLFEFCFDCLITGPHLPCEFKRDCVFYASYRLAFNFKEFSFPLRWHELRLVPYRAGGALFGMLMTGVKKTLEKLYLCSRG